MKKEMKKNKVMMGGFYYKLIVTLIIQMKKNIMNQTMKTKAHLIIHKKNSKKQLELLI